MQEEFIHTTMTESMPLISEWFGRVGGVLEKIPGLKGVGEGYQAIGAIADGLSLVYELIHEVKKADALEKGGKELVKRTAPVEEIAKKLLEKKFPRLPKPLRERAAKKLEELFEKYASDPLIERARKEMQKRDPGKDLDRSLFEDLKSLLTPTTGVVP